MLSCPRCGAAPGRLDLLQPGFQPCSGCGAEVAYRAYPALVRPQVPGSAGEALLVPDEASCFYHPAKRAAVPCDACGRFLCSLCALDLRGRRYCAPCLEAAARNGSLPELQSRRTLYDHIALSLALYPLLVFYLVVFTAPIALFFCIRYWKAPASLLRRTRTRMGIAAALALLELVGVVALIVFLVAVVRKG